MDQARAEIEAAYKTTRSWVKFHGLRVRLL